MYCALYREFPPLLCVPTNIRLTKWSSRKYLPAWPLDSETSHLESASTRAMTRVGGKTWWSSTFLERRHQYKTLVPVSQGINEG